MARTAVAVEQHTETLTLDALLARLFPSVTTRDLLRLTATSPLTARAYDTFFSKRNGSAWRTPPLASGGERLSDVIAANQDAELGISPLLHGSTWPSGPAKLTSIWVAVKIAPAPPPEATSAAWRSPNRVMTSFGQRVDAASETAVLDRLGALKTPPAIVLDEGFRLVAIWTLKDPSADLARVEKINALLARRLGGDPEAANPRTMTFGVPGQPQPGVFPRRLITATVMSDRRVALEDF